MNLIDAKQASELSEKNKQRIYKEDIEKQYNDITSLINYDIEHGEKYCFIYVKIFFPEVEQKLKAFNYIVKSKYTKCLNEWKVEIWW